MRRTGDGRTSDVWGDRSDEDRSSKERERRRESEGSIRDPGESGGSSGSSWFEHDRGSRRFGGSGSPRYGVASSQGYGGAVEREGYGGFGSEGDRSGRGSFGYSREAYGYGGGSRGSSSGFGNDSSSARDREWDRSGSEWAGGERGGYGGSSSSTFRSASRRKQSPKGYTRSDDRIREDVCDRLTESYLECEQVTVTVKDGEVVLGGRAPSGETRRQIERIAENVTGVRDVLNQIRTRGGEDDEDGSEERKTSKRGHESASSASSASSSMRKGGRKTV